MVDALLYLQWYPVSSNLALLIESRSEEKRVFKSKGSGKGTVRHACFTI